MAAAKRASTAARRLRDRDTDPALTRLVGDTHQRQRDAFEIATDGEDHLRAAVSGASTAARRLRDRDWMAHADSRGKVAMHQRQRDAFEIATPRDRRGAPANRRINGIATPSRSRRRVQDRTTEFTMRRNKQ